MWKSREMVKTQNTHLAARETGEGTLREAAEQLKLALTVRRKISYKFCENVRRRHKPQNLETPGPCSPV